MRKMPMAAILAICMTGSILAGCSDAAFTSRGNPSEMGVGSRSGEGAAEEPYVMTMVLTGSRQRDEERIEEKINEILVPALNVRLDIIMLPWSSAQQQLKLMLSGDEKIDCFYSGGTDAIQYMKRGQIINLKELIAQYGTNVKEIFGDEALNGISVNGFVYGVPAHCEGSGIPAVFMRKDLVEKYGIDVSAVKRPEDLTSVFAAVKAGEPDMTMLFSNGLSNGPLPRLGLNAYDPLGDNLGVLMNPTENTAVENLYASEWYMETAKMLYGWYRQGFISEGAATENESWNNLFKTGRVFAMFTGDHPGIMNELESSTGFAFVAADFAASGLKKSNYYSDIVFCMAQNCENPVKAMQCLDFIYGSADIMNYLNWGEEGIDYVFTDEENGLIGFPEGVTIENVGYSLNLSWELPNQYITHLWEGSDPGLYEEAAAFNAGCAATKALGFSFDSAGLDDRIAALNNVVSQYAPSIGSGTVDPEEYIPEFVRELEAAGINDVIAAKQRQLDAWMEENADRDGEEE